MVGGPLGVVAAIADAFTPDVLLAIMLQELDSKSSRQNSAAAPKATRLLPE